MSTTTDPRQAYVQTIDSAGTKLVATHAEIHDVADVSAGATMRAYTADMAILTNVETTVITLPVGAIVYDIIVNVTNASAEAATVNVGTAGTSNDPNGFFAALVTNAVGCYSAAAGNANAITVGGNETFRAGANFTGALLTKAYLVGSNAAEDTGIFASKPWFVATADPITYTRSGTITSHSASITVIYMDVSGFDVS